MTTELSNAAASLRSALPDDSDDHGHVVIESDAVRVILAALPTPPADDVREALVKVIHEAVYSRVAFHRLSSEEQGDTYRRAEAILAAFEVRPRGTVTDAARMEYTIAAESSNGAVTQLADYTTVVRDHLKADLYLFRQEEERLKGDPDRIFIAQRPLPKWVRS